MKRKFKLITTMFLFATMFISCTNEEKEIVDQSASVSSSNQPTDRRNNSIQLIAFNPFVNQFVNRVLVEEYSGTWCGNCPNILYGTQLLKQQTNKEVSVQIHRGSDPFVTAQGNTIATQQNVYGVPTGKINRTIDWTGPQYQNVNQVLNEIKPSSTVGLAINSTLNSSGILNLNIMIGTTNTAIQTKLVVYIVEDNLFFTQANYYANLYGGLNPIPNFEYDGVFRSAVSSTLGDTILFSGNQAQKNYAISVPTNVANISNANIVAFLIDVTTNSVLNVRKATIGESQQLERL